jgi:hypothetical protein
VNLALEFNKNTKSQFQPGLKSFPDALFATDSTKTQIQKIEQRYAGLYGIFIGRCRWLTSINEKRVDWKFIHKIKKCGYMAPSFELDAVYGFQTRLCSINFPHVASLSPFSDVLELFDLRQNTFQAIQIAQVPLREILGTQILEPTHIECCATEPWVAMCFRGGHLKVIDVKQRTVLFSYHWRVIPNDLHMFLSANFFVTGARNRALVASTCKVFRVDRESPNWEETAELVLEGDRLETVDYDSSFRAGELHSGGNPSLMIAWRYRDLDPRWSVHCIDSCGLVNEFPINASVVAIQPQEPVLRSLTVIKSPVGLTTAFHVKLYSKDGDLLLDRAVVNYEPLMSVFQGTDNLLAIVPTQPTTEIVVADILGNKDLYIGPTCSFRRTFMLSREQQVVSVVLVPGRMVVLGTDPRAPLSVSVHVYSL